MLGALDVPHRRLPWQRLDASWTLLFASNELLYEGMALSYPSLGIELGALVPYLELHDPILSLIVTRHGA